MNLPHSLSSLLALVAAAIPALAQSVTPFPAGPQRQTAVRIDEPRADGVFWIRGEAYKARCDRDGVTYYPRFGGAKAHTPIALRFRGSTSPAVERDGETLVWRHGATLTERWHARLDGMEQTFVLSAPPAGGELDLVVDVTTALTFAGRDQGLSFTAPGLGTVRYADGVVFDSKGERAAVIPEFDGKAIHLRVSPAFLARASYPLTIDPLLSTFAVTVPTLNAFHPDVVREPTTGHCAIVYEHVFNGADHDLDVRILAADGTFVRERPLDLTSDPCTDPKICATLTGTGLLVIWDNDGSGDGIQARNYRISTDTMASVQQVVSDGLGVDTRTPDVGGGTTVGTGNLGQMAVWVRVAGGVNFSLRGSALQSTGAPQGGEFVIDGSPGCEPLPDIAPSGGDPLHWAVVWQAKSPVCTDGDIWWAVLNPGGVQRAAAALEADIDPELVPRVSTHGKDSLVVWQQPAGSFGSDHLAVLMRRATASATWTQVGPKVSLAVSEPGVNRADNQGLPAVAFDGCRYSYMYMEGQRPKAACMFAPAYVYSEGHVALSPTTNNCGAPAIAHVPTAAAPTQFVAVWQENFGSHFEVRGAFYEGRSPGATVTTINTGCGRSGQTGIAIDRVPLVGARFTISLSNVAALPLIIAGPPAAAPVNLCAFCQRGVGTILASEFAATMAIEVPCEPTMVNTTLAFQGADFGAAGGCSAALFGTQFRTTDTLVVTVR